MPDSLDRAIDARLNHMQQAQMPPFEVLIARRRNRNRRRLAVIGTATLLAGTGGVSWGLLSDDGGAPTRLADDPTPTSTFAVPPSRAAIDGCLVNKGWKANGPGGFKIAEPNENRAHRERQFRADEIECYRSFGVHYNAQPVPTGVPYDDASAPLWFRDRAALFECGNLDLGLSGEVPESAKACLRNADKGAGAELGVSRNTDEGAPIITYYRTSYRGSDPEIMTDSTRDQFGERTWTAQTCKAIDFDTLQGVGCRLG